MMPMTKLPPITKLPKASMTWPAAAVPSCPFDRISRVEARLSDSRSMVEISRMVGKDENSSGAWMNSAVIRIRIDSVIEIASRRSSTIAGSGRISTTRMMRTPNASARSPRFRMSPISPRLGNPFAADALTRRDVDHGSCFPPRMPLAGAKRLRGGRRAAVSKVRHRTGVHGGSSRSTRLTTLDSHSAIFAGCMVSKGLTGGRFGPSVSPPPGLAFGEHRMTGSGGESSTPRPLGSITAASGILDRPPQCAIARKADDDELRVLAAWFARAFANSFAPLRKEGAGNAGCALHPRSRVPKTALWRTRAYRAAETLRHPLRNGFTAYFALSPVNGLVCHRRPREACFSRA